MGRNKSREQTAHNWKLVSHELRDSIITNEYESLRSHFVDRGVATDWSIFLREKGYFNDKDLSYFLKIKIDDSLIAEYRDWIRYRQPIKRIRKKQQDDPIKIELGLEKTMIKEMIEMIFKLRVLIMNFDDKQMSKSAYIELSKMTYDFYKKLDDKLNDLNNK